MNEEPFSNPFLGLVIMLVVAASVWAWWQALSRLAGGQGLLGHEARAQAPWGFVDLLIAVLLVFFAQGIAGEVLERVSGIQRPIELAELAPPARAAVLLGTALSTAAAFLLSVLLVRLRAGATLEDLGVDWARTSADLRLGGVAFVMLAPIVYAIQFLLVQWFESKHPLLELLQQDPDPRFFILSGVTALIVAPLAEEYFFRVLLQGWLERLAAGRGNLVQLLFGGRPGAGGQGPADPADAAGRGEVKLPDDGTGDGNRDTGGSCFPALWPVAVSALLFALAHAAHGPDPIPLFVLALGLGYLYQRTHRILPCIVVHFLLNTCSLVVLWLAVHTGGD